MKEQRFVNISQAECEPLSEDELYTFVSRSLRDEYRRAFIENIERRVLKRRMDWRGARLFEKLTVRLGNGIPLTLFLKCYCPQFDLDQPILGPSADREAGVYRDLLKSTQLGTAKFYGVHESNRDGRTLLLLEFVQGKRLKWIREQETWLAVAKWLAQMHHYFSHRQDELHTVASLYRHDSNFYWNWAYRATESASKVSAKARSVMECILMHYDKIADPLSNALPTLLHGEFYCTNILVSYEDQGIRICPFDWETSAIGCGALDLTYLLRQRLGVDRSRLIEAYLEGWHEVGGSPLSPTQLRQHMRRARVHELMLFIWSSVNYQQASAEKIVRYAERAERIMESL